MKLPRGVSGHRCVKAFTRLGFRFGRQTGSHLILSRDEPPCTLSVPHHRVVAPGTLRALLRDARITVEEFRKALR